MVPEPCPDKHSAGGFLICRLFDTVHRMKAETTFSLKDQLFNATKVKWLATRLTDAEPGFPSEKFQRQVVEALPGLELKQRIEHIAGELHKHLPSHYPDAVNIIIAALPPPLDPTLTDNDFGDFIIAPLGHYIASYGCSKKHLKLSLKALEEITQRFSAEDAIRGFINAHTNPTMAFLERCSRHKNYHVRRLASEGTRPSLPWCQKITIDHKTPLSILDRLHSDPTRYVARSVANHLNDISKFDAELVINTLKQWKQQKLQAPGELEFISKHALRTLVKDGNRKALGLLGYGRRPDIAITGVSTTTPRVKLGSNFEFDLEFVSNRRQNLAIDYVMLFASDGKRSGRKVFKLKTVELVKGETCRIHKNHPMRLMTTRRLYPGRHEITLQVNGVALAELSFVLEI